MRYEVFPPLADWIRDSNSLGSKSRVSALKTAFLSGGTGPVATGARPADLADIDKHVDLYWKAWSMMAKRNIIVDLVREIEKWNVAHPGKLPSAIDALKDVAVRTSNQLSPPGRYTNVICAGWAIGCNYRASTGLMHRD